MTDKQSNLSDLLYRHFFEFIFILFRIYQDNDNDKYLINDFFKNMFCVVWTTFVIILIVLAI